MSSSSFERQTGASGHNDETPSDTNSTSPTSHAPQQYPQAPSFIEYDRPAVRLVELPAWLQSFAASEGEPGDSEDAPAIEAAEPLEIVECDENEIDLEEFDEFDRGEHPQESDAASFKAGFISEDDLPEWLRSIGPIDGEDASGDPLQIGRQADQGPFAIPRVTRAWTTPEDARPRDEASSLFTQVASQASGSVRAMSAAELADGGGTAPRRDSVANYGSSMPPGFEPATSAAASVADEPVPPVEIRSGIPMLPLVVAGVLILVLAVVAMVLFVL